MNDSAFPVRDENQPEYGLTKLQYAAIQICAGLSANPNFTHSESVDRIAEMAASQARALFVALSDAPNQ